VGNTLTTIVPVASGSVASKVTIEVRRAAGLTARRAELDGFTGAMTRLRAAYDALQQTGPVASAPDQVIEAMQTGDRLSYHPELAAQEITHFRTALLEAQTSVQAIDSTFVQRLNESAKRYASGMSAAEVEVQKQRRLDALHRADRLVAEAGK
jgi:alpha-glucosidase